MADTAFCGERLTGWDLDALATPATATSSSSGKSAKMRIAPTRATSKLAA
jgi:hypothetical protein